MSDISTPLDARGRAFVRQVPVLREYGIVVATIVLAAAFSIARPQFLSISNLTGILGAVAIVGIMAVCSTFVILTGGIDLSVGSVMTLSGLAASYVLSGSGWSLLPALVVGLLVGVGAGLASGVMVGVFRFPPIIVTLAMMSLVRSIAYLINKAELHSIDGPGSYLYLGGGTLLGLKFQVWIFAGVAAAMLLVQAYTRLGFTVFAVGENERAARLSGLPVIRTKVVVYIVSGLGAALAGMILSSGVSTATSTYGLGYELDVIAAVVVGGTSLFGGRGSVHRSVLGALLIGVINNGLTLLNVPIAEFMVVKGVIIILALAADQYLRLERE